MYSERTNLGESSGEDTHVSSLEDGGSSSSPLSVYSAYLGRIEIPFEAMCVSAGEQNNACSCGANVSDFTQDTGSITCCVSAHNLTVRVVDYDDVMATLGLQTPEQFQSFLARPSPELQSKILDRNATVPGSKIDLETNRAAYFISLVCHMRLVVLYIKREELVAEPVLLQNYVSELEKLLELVSTFLQDQDFEWQRFHLAHLGKTVTLRLHNICGGFHANQQPDFEKTPTVSSLTSYEQTFFDDVLSFGSQFPTAMLDVFNIGRIADVYRALKSDKNLLHYPGGQQHESASPILEGLLEQFDEDDCAETQELYNFACNYNAPVDIVFCTREFLLFAQEMYGIQSLAQTDHVLCIAGVPRLDNAFYTPTGIMVFGQGHQHFTTLVSSDVVAHELAHGICRDTCDLNYTGESGALNESFSDLMAAAFEFHLYNKFSDYIGDFKGVSDWEIGEDLARNYGRRRLRHMQYPRLGMQPQPDQYAGEYWIDPSNLSVDHGGVHINSGVGNRLFYLVATKVFMGDTATASKFFFTCYSKGLWKTAKFCDLARTLTAHLSPFLETEVKEEEGIGGAENYGGAGHTTAQLLLQECIQECNLAQFLQERQEGNRFPGPRKNHHKNRYRRLPRPRQENRQRPPPIIRQKQLPPRSRRPPNPFPNLPPPPPIYRKPNTIPQQRNGGGRPRERRRWVRSFF